ncbi:hypothetical protein EJ04DRAFT_556253 [Polyplosphaeria fusca]|uniref:Heterokaryon incompatibility domain-containing protein n=1 Tax=Polyplosphaeria fusca TaxID=682080 RepID=A0A9P4QMH6_9PLEO|nr:hypothetical protein EJ04DRAFT_556253 [Polyplosphaeria fusca]
MQSSKAWPRYEYKALERPGSQIRIVTICTGKWHEDIVCIMRDYEFDATTPPYETLSYVWGDPLYVWGDSTNARVVEVNKKSFGVTDNLFYAMRRIREVGRPRDFWIDALCINQKDAEEKSRQVEMMGLIFKKCQQVFCWLGEDLTAKLEDSSIPPESLKAQHAFELLRILGSYRHEQAMSVFMLKKGSCLTPTEQATPLFDALVHLLELQWWYRVWVVQEFSLPPRVTFIYASERAPHTLFTAAFDNIWFHVHKCCRADISPRLDDDSIVNKAVVLLLTTVRSITTIRDDVDNNRHLSLKRLRIRLCSSQATDRRDLFYAVNGLSQNTSIRPDYTVSIRTAHARIILEEIKSSRSLLVLTGPRHLASSHRELPSWIAPTDCETLPPGWTTALERMFERTTTYRASTHHDPDVKLVENEHLITKSLDVDKIKHLSIAFIGSDPTPASIRQTLAQWIDMAGLADASSRLNKLASTDSRSNTFWRTLLFDRVLLSDRGTAWDGWFEPSADHDVEMKTFLSSIIHEQLARREHGVETEARPDCIGKGVAQVLPHAQNQETLFPKFWSWKQAFTHLDHRKLFITEQGALGLAPSMAEVGDEVHVPKGSPAPFVLRPAAKGRSNSPRKYTVIGDCYLHGIMDGESVEGRGPEMWETIELL